MPDSGTGLCCIPAGFPHLLFAWVCGYLNVISLFAIFWIFWSKIKITRADVPTIWMDCLPILTNWYPHLCHSQHFYAGYPSWYNPPIVSCLWTGTKYVGLHTRWLGQIYWKNFGSGKILAYPDKLSVLDKMSPPETKWELIRDLGFFWLFLGAPSTVCWGHQTTHIFDHETLQCAHPMGWATANSVW